jgi:hypothetical protein
MAAHTAGTDESTPTCDNTVIGESRYVKSLRQFPLLVNCCTIDWCMPLALHALRFAAIKFLKEIDMEERQRKLTLWRCARRSIGRSCCFSQVPKLQVINYVTPTSQSGADHHVHHLTSVALCRCAEALRRCEPALVLD